MAAVLSAVCAIVAATVSVLIWRRVRSNDLSAKIDDGDKATRKHADQVSRDIKQQLTQQTNRMGELEESMARMEQQQAHTLTARDLGAVHEKINRVAEQISANSAMTQAMREQLRVIQEHLMRERK
ncbi:MAG: hypothetical protein WA961_14665 [Rhodanobacter sp.]